MWEIQQQWISPADSTVYLQEMSPHSLKELCKSDSGANVTTDIALNLIYTEQFLGLWVCFECLVVQDALDYNTLLGLYIISTAKQAPESAL